MRPEIRIPQFCITVVYVVLLMVLSNSIVSCKHRPALIKKTSHLADSLIFYHHRVNTEKKNEIKSRHPVIIVKSLTIIILKPSGSDILDTGHHVNKFLDRVINKSHRLSHTSAVKRLLLFKVGDTISPGRIAESERMLRKFMKIRDARIIVSPVKGHSTYDSVTVIVQDLMALNVGANNIYNIYSYSMADRNLLGYGSNIYGSLSFNNKKYSSYSVYYQNPSLFSSYLDLTMSYSNADSNYTNGIKLNKNFFTGLFTWAGGAGYSSKNNNRYQFNGSDVIGNYKSLISQTDAWVGKSFTVIPPYIRHNESIRNFLISSRVIFTNEIISQKNLSDSLNQTLINKTGNKVLFSLGYISRRYYKDSYIFRFKYSEDIPEGFLFSIIGGKSINAYYANNYYAGFTAGLANNNRVGYWNLSYQYVRSISTFNPLDNRVNSFKLFYLSPLLLKKKFKDRILINTRVQKISNDLVSNRLYINNDDGFLNINSRLLSGLIKTSVNVTNIIYTPYKPLGFYVGFFTYAALANINQANDLLFTNKWYQSYGVGILLRNENLLINSFRLAFTYYPSFPNNTYKFNPLWIYELQIPEMSINQPEFEIN